MTSIPVSDGLEGVVVAETELSQVDGQGGQLIIRGHDVRALAATGRFADVCRLLWTGQPDRAPGGQPEGQPESQKTIARQLYIGRSLGYQALSGLGDALGQRDGMDALRAAVAHLRVDDMDRSEPDGAGDIAAGARLTGAVATMVAAWWRAIHDLPAIAPDEGRTHAADILSMLGRGSATAAEVRALDAYLCTVVEHGMNASTFTARVVTSTGAGMVPAVVAAIGALAGPLHGGAPGPVLDMLDAVAGTADDRAAASAWVASELAAGRRIMGMGHRVYRVRDPRAAVLEQAAQRLADASSNDRIRARLALAQVLEQAAEEHLRARYPDRSLRANVEFYTAVLLDALGIDRRLFTLLFAAARTAGWMAHIFEQRARGRLIRPKARYVGRRVGSTAA